MRSLRSVSVIGGFIESSSPASSGLRFTIEPMFTLAWYRAGISHYIGTRGIATADTTSTRQSS
jgi:hypothetical protein